MFGETFEKDAFSRRNHVRIHLPILQLNLQQKLSAFKYHLIVKMYTKLLTGLYHSKADGILVQKKLFNGYAESVMCDVIKIVEKERITG